MRWCGLLVLTACAEPNLQPPVVGEPPVECRPPRPVHVDDVGGTPAPAPRTWLVIPFPLHDLDCASLAPRPYTRETSITWRDRGVVRSEVVQILSTTAWTATAGTCVARVRIQVLGGPAGRPGVVQPCQVFALSEAWASLQVARLDVAALSVDDERRELAWSVQWQASLADACHDVNPFERGALGLTLTTELAVARADLHRLVSSSPPLLAVAVAIDTL